MDNMRIALNIDLALILCQLFFFIGLSSEGSKVRVKAVEISSSSSYTAKDYPSTTPFLSWLPGERGEEGGWLEWAIKVTLCLLCPFFKPITYHVAISHQF